MDEIIKNRILRAKELLRVVDNAAMATVNSDGSPHNTPFFLMHDESFSYVYWASNPLSLHSINAERTGQVFIVVYESNAGGGLYIEANETKRLDGQDLEIALEVHNKLRAFKGREPLPYSQYTTDSPQRMYRAKPIHFYVNNSERDNTGKIIRDYRHEIPRNELIS